MSRSFILINGAPGSGKDTAAELLYNFISDGPIEGDYYLEPVWEKFSLPLKRSFAAMVGAKVDWRGNVEGYEERKEEPLAILGGRTFRNFQQDMSERFMKLLYGKTVFAEMLLTRAKNYETANTYDNDGKDHFVFIVSDCGFQIEADALVNEHVLLINMEREGKTYDGDTREKVHLPNSVMNALHSPGWTQLTVWNNKTVEDLEPLLRDPVLQFLSRFP